MSNKNVNFTVCKVLLNISCSPPRQKKKNTHKEKPRGKLNNLLSLESSQ